MNVTNNGYFTSQYLAQHTQNPRSYQSGYFPDQEECESNEYVKITPRQRFGYNLQSQTTSPNHSSSSLSVPPSPISETGSMNTRSNTPFRSFSPRGEGLTGSAIDHNMGKDARQSISPKQFDPDDLTEEITPAQLNYLQQPTNLYKNQVITFDDSSYVESGLPSPTIIRSTKLNLKPAKTLYEGYYIQQKERYDNSEIKPKLYTHKTFHDVFDNKNELTDIYNPIEFVFNSKNNNQFSQAFNAFRVKMGKDDYKNYDYYAKKSRPQEVFVKEQEYDEEDPEAGETGLRKKPLKKLFKTKFKRVKKQLGQDFIENTDRQLDLHNQLKSGSFSLNNTKSPENEPIAVTTPDTPSPRSKRINGKAVKDKSSKYWKQVVTKFNSPTGMIFKDGTRIGKRNQIVVEAEDETDIKHELYFNQETGQLQPQSPNLFDLGDGILSKLAKNPLIEPYYQAIEPMIQKSYPILFPYATKLHPTNFTNGLRQYEVLKQIFSPLDRIGEQIPILVIFIHLLEQLLFLWLAWETFKIVKFIFHILKVISSPFQRSK